MEQVLDPISPPMEEKEMLTEEVLQALRQTEFYGLTIPEKYGGKGWAMVEWFPVLEEWAKGYAMIRLLAHCMNGIFWRPLYIYGNEEQKEKISPKACQRGDIRGQLPDRTGDWHGTEHRYHG